MRNAQAQYDHQAIPGTRLQRLVTGCLLATLLGAGASQALAQTHTDAGCEQEGKRAEKLALARDRGLNEQQAVNAVMKQEPGASRKELAEAAELLFHRFRRMAPEQAAFEFMASCLDEAQ
jgi:hypothetical protein